MSKSKLGDILQSQVTPDNILEIVAVLPDVLIKKLIKPVLADIDSKNPGMTKQLLRLARIIIEDTKTSPNEEVIDGK